MAEDHTSISSSRMSAQDVSRASFAIVRRGFDSREVRSFLDHISRELEAAEARETELRHQVSEAEKRAANPVIDESHLTAALGQQSAQVLRDAHEEARKALEAAQAQATEMLQAAQARAGAAAVETEQRVAERIGDAEQVATALEAEATDTAAKITAQARSDGDTLVAHAREQGRQMIEQAQDARARVLADMNARRRMMHLQIEQLRAARDEIARSVIAVRETVDKVTGELSESDERARGAAKEVARRQPTAETVRDEAAAEASIDAASLDKPATTTAEVDGADQGGPEAGVVEELFAKIRASARSDEESEDPEADVAPASPTGPDAEVLLARDELLEGPLSALSRKIKRTLADEQNRILDELRATDIDGREALLGVETEQSDRFAAAAIDALGDAAVAGRQFALAQGSAEAPGLSDGAIGTIAQELATKIVAPLRRRLAEALGSPDPTIEVNTAFREWRGARVDRVVGDAALESFFAAVIAVVGDGEVRWAVGGAGDPCPDCADNSLEASVSAGSTFPTGQAHPPAHPGCRCAVVPV